MICLRCSKEFEPTHGNNKKYCSFECRQRNGENAWYKRNTQKVYDKNRKNDLKKHYGISLEDYNRLFREQNGCCRMCERHQSELKDKLHVDHCHKTKRIRGLLCHNCNIAIGHLKENLKTIERALEYLKLPEKS